MAKLKIAEELALPMAAVTEVLGFLGRRGQGKSYAAQKLAELMHDAGAPFVVLDPVGNWYGLRLAADGKTPGIPIPVFGGLHGDVPLEPTAGKLIADLIADRNISAVLDVSQFESDADKARFAHDFGARFYYRRKQAPAAVHLFLEECQEFVPQNPMGDEKRVLHVFQRMTKLGRNYGIGVSLISQRPQEVNKKVLNLTELLFVFQLTGPHERKAVEGWIQEKGIDELPATGYGRRAARAVSRMTTLSRALLAFMLALVFGYAVSAQRIPEEWAKSLWLMPGREAWVLADWLPGRWQICASLERGELRGCVSAADLRTKAELERKSKKAEEEPE